MVRIKATHRKVFLFFVLCVILASCVCCGKSGQTNNSDNDGTIFREHMQDYGNYIYTDFGVMKRYSINANTLTKACLDPGCDGSCALETQTLLKGVCDGKLFFRAEKTFTHSIYIGYQDLVSGEVAILKETSKIGSTFDDGVFVCGGYLYYVDKILRIGGSQSNPDDYIPYVCRVGIDDGKEEHLFVVSNEKLFMVCEDVIITLEDPNILYVYEIGDYQRKPLCDVTESGYLGIVNTSTYKSGKIYIRCSSEDKEYSEYSNGYYGLYYLVSVDVHSGELERVIDEPVYNFYLSAEGIYYVKMRLRHMYIPEDYREYPEKIKVFMADDSIHFRRYDGTGDEVLYTNENISLGNFWVIRDNVLYGYLMDFDEEIHTFSGTAYFGVIDFSTGSITRVEDQTKKQ